MFYFDSKLHIFEQLTNAAGGYWYTAVQETSKSFVVLFYTPEKKNNLVASLCKVAKISLVVLVGQTFITVYLKK